MKDGWNFGDYIKHEDLNEIGKFANEIRKYDLLRRIEALEKEVSLLKDAHNVTTSSNMQSDKVTDVDSISTL